VGQWHSDPAVVDCFFDSYPDCKRFQPFGGWKFLLISAGFAAGKTQTRADAILLAAYNIVWWSE